MGFLDNMRVSEKDKNAEFSQTAVIEDEQSTQDEKLNDSSIPKLQRRLKSRHLQMIAIGM
jgi:amino acid permease